MPWKCPECEAEITYLKYSVTTTGTEYGSADLDDENQSHGDRIIEHSCDDSDGGEWDGSPDYSCPECDTGLSEDDVVWEDEEEEDEEECSSGPKKEVDEETLHNIITPSKPIISKDNPKDASTTSIICKKCFHLFVRGKDDIYGEEFCECPKCGESNSTTEFQKLLKEGYYSIKKHAHK